MYAYKPMSKYDKMPVKRRISAYKAVRAMRVITPLMVIVSIVMLAGVVGGIENELISSTTAAKEGAIWMTIMVAGILGSRV